jgi:hypothetical protein
MCVGFVLTFGFPCHRSRGLGPRHTQLCLHIINVMDESAVGSTKARHEFLELADTMVSNMLNFLWP